MKRTLTIKKFLGNINNSAVFQHPAYILDKLMKNAWRQQWIVITCIVREGYSGF